MVKNLPANAGNTRHTALIPGVRKIPWRRACNPLQYSYLENPQGQRSLVGYSPWGHRESGTNEMTEHACTHLFIWLHLVLAEAGGIFSYNT